MMVFGVATAVHTSRSSSYPVVDPEAIYELGGFKASQGCYSRWGPARPFD